RNRHPVYCAANIDVGEVERLAVKGNEALRPDLTDIVPEVGQQLPLVRLAVGARPVEFDPVNADTNDPARARIEAEAIENLLAFLIGFHIQKNLACTGRNRFLLLSNGFDIDDKCCWLPHFKLTSGHQLSRDRGQVRGPYFFGSLKSPLVVSWFQDPV